MSAGTAADLARLRRRGFRLEYASIAWISPRLVAITAGLLVGSIALTGFGLDSLIELASSAIVIWQLRGEAIGQDRDTRVVRLIGVTFFALAAYLTAESIYDLITGAGPGGSPAGLAITAAALLVMPALAVAKRRTGALGSRTLVADSAETAFCGYTSAAALLGVALKPRGRVVASRPTAGLVIAVLAVREGLECWEKEEDDDQDEGRYEDGDDNPAKPSNNGTLNKGTV